MTLLTIALLFAFCMLLGSLTGGNINYSSTNTVNGQNAAQGTGTSTLSPLQTTLTSTSPGSTLNYGTGSGQVNILVSQDRTLAASASETLDLFGATTPLLDIFASPALIRHIKYILIYILPNTGDIGGLTVGNAASDPWVAGAALGGTAPTLTIYPNGTPFQLGEPTVGLPVTALSGQLKVANNSAAVATSYRITIAGTTL